MAKAALAQAGRFSADAVVPRYEALYRLVLAKRDPSHDGQIHSDAVCVR
jgi:hypothetical protein